MHPKVLGQLHHRFVALERLEGHPGLEVGPMIPSCAFHRLAPLIDHPSVASVAQGYHLAHCPNFRDPLWERTVFPTVVAKMNQAWAKTTIPRIRKLTAVVM